MDKVLIKHKLQKTTQGETENLNICVTIRHIGFIIYNFLTKKTTVLNSFTGKFCQTPTEEITPILHTFLENKRY